jgi:hypothetical protein
MHWDTITDPFKDFVSNIFDYLPQLVAALALVVLAWILAKVARRIVARVVQATKLDDKIGEGQFKIAQRAGTIVWWAVWVFFFLVVLEVLGMEGALTPIQSMFETIIGRVPDVAAAAVILGVAWVIGGLLRDWITRLLAAVRFNEVPAKLGLAQAPTEGTWAAASIVGYIVLVLIMLFAVIAAADILDFPTANDLIADFTAFFAKVVLGVVVLGIGVFLAKFVAGIVRAANQPPALASTVQVFIIVLTVALSLRTMGFANDIVVLGFGLMLGAIAVAVAVAFGMGGREVARDQLERWVNALRSKPK